MPENENKTGTAEKNYGMVSLLKRSMVYSFSDLTLRLIGFFLIPLYTRALTPEQYGIIGYTTAITQILGPLLSLGLINTFPIFYHALGPEDRNKTLSSIINFTLFYGLLITVALSFLGQPIFALVSGDVPFRPYIIMALWGLFFNSFYYLPLGIFNMKEQTVTYATYSVGLSLFTVVANIVLVLVYRLGVIGILWANIATGLVGMFVAFYCLRNYYSAVIDWKKLKTVLFVSLPTLPHLFSGNLWRFADRFFLVGMVSLAVTGIYSLAMTVSSAILIILGGIYNALNPIFQRRANKQDADLPRVWSRMCSFFVLGSALTGLGLTIMGPELIRFLAPPKYYEAMYLLPVLVLGQILIGVYWMAGPGAMFKRKTWIFPMASIPAAIINILLNIFLIPKYSSVGAAWAMVGSAFVQVAIFIYFSDRYYHIPYELGQIAKIVVLSTLIFIFSKYLSFSSIFVSVTAKFLLIMILPVTLLFINFFHPGEMLAMRKRLSSLLSLVNMRRNQNE